MRKKDSKRIPVWLIGFLTIFLWLTASADGLQVTANGAISGYQSNPLTVIAPEAGRLKLDIHDENTLYRSLEYDVPEGKSQVVWDGLGWNEERLARKTFQIQCTMTGVSGTVYETMTEVRVAAAQQAILFALPSDETVYLEETSDWFLEFKLLYTDQLTVSFFEQDSDTLVLQVSRQMKGGKVNRISFHTLLGKNRLEPKTYRVRACGQQHPSNGKEFTLTVAEGKRPVLPLTVTGDIMPKRGDSDAEIWAKMMAPATVVDIPNVSHQKVYQSPESGSSVLGPLHGQSQSLSILEIQDDWVRIQAWNHEKGAPMEGWVPRKVLKVVQPQSRYGLLVDKKAQTLTLYEYGKAVDTLLVSTGRMAKGELYQETAAGSFLTDEHMTDYSTNGLKYDFVIRYDGGNLLHQIPYAWSESGKKDMLPGEMYLGTKASHACIRVQEKPSDTGLNAYWFWTHLPYHTRIVVLDDPEEREKLETLVTEETPDLRSGLASAWQVAPDEPETGQIVLTFGGDVVLGARESYYGLPEGLPAFLDREGTAWPFSGLRDLFSRDDLTSVNLECVLKEDGQGEDIEKAWRFRGLPSYIQALTDGQIELVNLANNHTIDYGEAGYASTIAALLGKVDYCGNGECFVKEINGHVFGFGGCRETYYCQNPEIIASDIQTLREKGAEFVIYQCHWGTEYDPKHNALQEAMARACHRAGADLVIGHHPHVVQGIDFIDDMPVIYSLGNLMFGGTIRLSTYDGLLLQASFFPDRKTDQIQLRLIPVLTSSSASQKINDYQPRIAMGDDALRILEKVQKDTPFLLTERVSVLY